jgi:hypothetical protein
MNLSPERLDLLRAAYPDGFFAKRGVRTVGGWECWTRGWITPDGRVFPPIPNAHPTDEFARAVEAGALLPDLSDPATFYLALCDLAEAGPPFEASGVYYVMQIDSGLLWRFEGWKRWSLTDGRLTFPYDVDRIDPQGALLSARASMQKPGRKKS